MTKVIVLMIAAFLLCIGTREYGWHPIFYMIAALLLALASGIAGYCMGLADGGDDEPFYD